jgi:hypothetical protein
VEDLLKRAQAVFQVTLTQWTTVTGVLTAQHGADLDLYLARFVGGEWVIEGSSYQEGTPPEVIQLRLPPGRYLVGVHRYSEPGTSYTLRLLATPAPDPERVPERARIRYLILGDVTTSSAVARWETTLETPSVVYYRLPLREEGSSTRTRSHLLRLTGLVQGQFSPVAIAAASEGGLDEVPAFLVAALPAAGFAAPRLVADTVVGPRDAAGVVPVIVVLENEGLGDAMNVRNRQVTLPAGWQVVGATPLPPTLDVGGIGARGVGLLVLQLQRLSGSTAPNATIRGTYTDAAGLERQF